ncbi:MAG: hypothetical protein QF368_11600, partial [SAR202 cluster bacterium]|nr:hypothetical protein [SAR202 cluster bacterium]
NELFRITSDGEVGIGESKPCDGDPNCLLHVNKSGANRVRIHASDNQQAGLDLHSGDSQMILTYDTETGVKFWNGDRGVTDLFIHNDNGYVGINTSSPKAPLEVHGENASHYGAIFKNISATGQGVLIRATDGSGSAPVLRVEDNSQNAKLVVGENGNVGIGADNPTNKLQVHGRISVRNTDDAVLQLVANKGSDSYIHWVEDEVDQRGVLGFAKGSYDLVYRVQASNLTNGGERLRITGDGNVGIGIEKPDAKLAVNGAVKAKEFVTAPADWPDYVFDDDYDLMNLNDVEAAIDRDGHLPGVASASDIANSGLKLGEMDVVLLKKIEELTLYTIDQEKQLKDLQSEISLLKSGNPEFHHTSGIELIKSNFVFWGLGVGLTGILTIGLLFIVGSRNRSRRT